ncbi:7-deoxyloganetin glucosyltransferase [Setaria viridis]|uniref:7-deoxyloganetin glucosyltransferase n=1 Tax=Setaria viridis TaxID=4556 RepID=UPI00149356D5|nr:7-deoxyloganetin glucosyltransferase-like [Setaria viridis]
MAYGKPDHLFHCLSTDVHVAALVLCRSRRLVAGKTKSIATAIDLTSPSTMSATAPPDAASVEKRKPAAHAVFFPFPAQGHVKAALHLAKLVHERGGVRVTFVHSDRNRRRVLRSRGPDALAGAPGFAFASVPDGLPPPSGEGGDDGDTPQYMVALLSSLETSAGSHLKKLLDDAAAAGAPATCVVSDVESVLRAAGEVGVPAVAFWTPSACGLMASQQCQQLIDKGFVPLSDAAQLSNGYLDSTVIDWVPGMPADMRLRDFPSFIRTTDADDAMLRRVLGLADCVRTVASAVVLNTFDELEGEVVEAMSAFLPPIYAVGPVPLLAQQVVVAGGGAPPLDAPPAASLTKEDDGCLAWLGTKRPRSVVYANFGSIAVLTTQQIEEFAWGLANSGYEFLMVIRDDQANGASGGGITPKFVEETKGRCYVTRWCPQVAVLRHEAVGAFLTHCGWNSMLESICSGVPMLCWPFGADQQTNCRFACMEWRVGVEVGGDVKRAEVEALVRDVMGRGEKGMELRRRAAEWKERAAAASEPGGSSRVNLDRLVNEVFHPSKKEL